ncbi:MAG TPA: homoserine O-succinyltransferase [Gammaproteobacteria bacterium]
MSAHQHLIFSPEVPATGSIVLPAFRARHARRPGHLTIRYTRSSDPALGLPVVVVLGGVSANADVIACADRSPGWWCTQAGTGCALDTNRYDVISMDFITGGGIDGADCRHIATGDQADALAALLNALHIRRLHAFVGASYGAMVALCFAARYPERLARLIAISGAHVAHPRAVAIRSIQRRIIHLARDAGKPAEGVALARALAIAGYREHAEFAARFSGPPKRFHKGFRFPVEDYLEHNGRKYAARVDADDYYQLCESLDLHDVDPSGITTPATLIAADPDFLVPLSQMQELAERLRGPAQLHVLRTAYGHDAFLKEPVAIAGLLRDALEVAA